MTSTDSHAALREAMYELSMAEPVPDATLLDEVVRRFPEHASALTDFAIELALDALREDDSDIDDVGASVDLENVSPAVSRAMSRFQNRLHAVERLVEETKAQSAVALAALNPFVGLSRHDYRALAQRLGANAAFVNKLRDRQIEPETVPAGFTYVLAAQLNVPIDVVLAHLAAPGARGVPTGQFLKADRKPDSSLRQTFEEAVRGSGLSDEQQHLLLGR